MQQQLIKEERELEEAILKAQVDTKMEQSHDQKVDSQPIEEKVAEPAHKANP